MRTLTIELDDEVYHRLEVLAARDDDRITTGVERFLTELTLAFEEKRLPVMVHEERNRIIKKEFGSD